MTIQSDPVPSELSEADKLHAAICQAVEVLNVTPEIARLKEGRQVSAILRGALVAYADDFMDQPAPEQERAAIHKKHSGDNRGSDRTLAPTRETAPAPARVQQSEAGQWLMIQPIEGGTCTTFCMTEAEADELAEFWNKGFQYGAAIKADREQRPAALSEACSVPPEGWACSRAKGHEGPCAASPEGPTTKEWCKDYPASAAWIINNLAQRIDAGADREQRPAALSEAVPDCDACPMEPPYRTKDCPLCHFREPT